MKNSLVKILSNNIAGSGFVSGRIRIKLLKFAGMNVKNKVIGSGCYFSGNKVAIGEGSWVNFRCSFESHIERVEIGKNCAIAMGVLFCTSSHNLTDTPLKRAGKETHKPIIVKDGCWIGANSTILQGVTIEEGCVIAAGSVVNKDCYPNGLYAGTPAKRIKDLPIESGVSVVI